MAIDPRVQKLASDGFLSCLEPRRREELVDAGHLVELIRGQPLGPSVHEGCILLMLTGLLRVFLQSPAGRQVTVRYARPGDALGLVHLFGMKTAVHGQAVGAVTLWSLPGEPLRKLALSDARFALAIAAECADRTVDAMEELRLVTFGSVRQRLSRHLLDLAGADEQGTLVAHVTQQELADAAGTVREVVARALKEMRRAGLIGEAEGRIALLDTRRLDDEAAGRVT